MNTPQANDLNQLVDFYIVICLSAYIYNRVTKNSPWPVC